MTKKLKPTEVDFITLEAQIQRKLFDLFGVVLRVEIIFLFIHKGTCSIWGKFFQNNAGEQTSPVTFFTTYDLTTFTVVEFSSMTQLKRKIERDVYTLFGL